MSTFTVTIETDGIAFDSFDELPTLLAKVSYRMEQRREARPLEIARGLIMDSNGDAVGEWEWTP